METKAKTNRHGHKGVEESCRLKKLGLEALSFDRDRRQTVKVAAFESKVHVGPINLWIVLAQPIQAKNDRITYRYYNEGESFSM
jgi:hypothetical protein